MRRRALLATALTTGLAGCSLGTGGTDPVRLGVVDIQNSTDSEQRLGVTVLADGAVTHETTVRLAAASADAPTTERLAKQWPDRADSYTLRLDSRLEDTPVTVGVDDSRTDSCERLLVVLRPGNVVPYRGSDGRCYGSATEG